MSRPVLIQFGELLQIIKDRLISLDVFSPSEVKIAITEEQDKHSPSDIYCRILPGPQVPMQNVVNGLDGERVPLKAQIKFEVWHRVHLDMNNEDEAALTHANLGIYPRLNSIAAALQHYDPADVDENYILWEPMRVLLVDAPSRHEDGRTRGVVFAEVKYVMDT